MMTMPLTKSILASDRVSRIKLTIHFSPSSGDKFNRSDKSLPSQHFIQKNEAVLDIDNLMNSTISLCNQMPRTFDKLFGQTRQKEITFQHSLNLDQLPLRKFKIKIDIQRIHKLRNRVRVLVRFLFDDLNEVTNLFLVGVSVALAELGGDDCGRQVADDPG